MLEELEYNLWEHILQRLVDYGHAFSPEIEMAALEGDEAMLLHGEAVNIDMALTTQVGSITALPWPSADIAGSYLPVSRFVVLTRSVVLSLQICTPKSCV